MSLNAVAHDLVFANRRKKIDRLIAAVGSSFLSSQQHCGVLLHEGRRCLVPRQHIGELCKYTTGIVRNRHQKLIAINSEPDHMHTFVGLKLTIALSDLVRDIKAGSSGFINDKKWIRGQFNWQEGFGAFSHSHSEIDRVVRYIQNQTEHHRKKTFKEEYQKILKDFAVGYDAKYLFKWIEGE